MVVCQFTAYGHAHGPKDFISSTSRVQILRNAYIWNRWADFLHFVTIWSSLELFRSVAVHRCGHSSIWPMDQNSYMYLLWSCWTDFFRSKFDGITLTCSCAASCRLSIWHIWACPLLPTCPIWVCPSARMWIFETVWWVFSVWRSMELFRLVVVHHLRPFDQYGLHHGPKHISLKPLDGFSRFEVLWDWLHLQLCLIMVVWLFNPYGLPHGSECISTKPHDVFCRSKFCGIIWICSSCTMSWFLFLFCFCFLFATYNLDRGPNNCQWA